MYFKITPGAWTFVEASFVLLVIAFLALPCAARAANEPAWELQLPGVSYHFGSPDQPGKRWKQFHDGLGLQRTAPGERYVWRATAGFMRDSYNHQGLYAGASVGYRVYDSSVKAELAAAPMLLYRTTRFDDHRGKAPHRLIPIVMPMIILSHPESGFGANITVLPGGNFGKDLHFPGLIYVQLTYRLR
ncbi:MAG TPA: hypothetical protein VFR86_25875 [Burkholderiaceae bacterium]|nr:hypothetical protein [Burkholderiaceae bacterium]